MNLNGNSAERTAGIWLFLLLIVMAIVIAVVSYSVVVNNLPQYVWQQTGDLVAPNGLLYSFDDALYTEYAYGKLKADKLVGLIEGESGIRVYSLRGYKVEEALLIRGLMIQDVVSTKYQNR